MSKREDLMEQIEKTRAILAESQEYYKENPQNYSARLLLMTTENHLGDLLIQLEKMETQK